MPTVRLRDAAEYPDAARALFALSKTFMEVLGIAQMFSSYTKIADTLQLEPDMGDIAPVDLSPAPGGRAVRRIALPRRSRARAGTPARPPRDRLARRDTP